MKPTSTLTFALILFWSSNFFAAPLRGTKGKPVRGDVLFTYQKLTDPFPETRCSTQALPNPYDRKVMCELDGIRHEFVVHLALGFYPKTIEGVSAYELLYWVTDFTDPKLPKNDSTTLWIHNSHEENRMKRIESSLGIENDEAYLRLKIRL